jgi:hypothetical protein
MPVTLGSSAAPPAAVVSFNQSRRVITPAILAPQILEDESG